MANQGKIPRLYIPNIRIRNPIYRLPVFGQWAQRLGQISAMIATPCDIDPLIMIEGFFYNIPKLLWSFVSPDLNDSIVSRAGRKHGKQRHGIFNIESWIDPEPNSIALPGYAQFMFKLGSLAQELGWYFLIVDATTEFMVNWLTTVYQWSGCNTQLGPFMSSDSFSSAVGPGNNQTVLWGRNLQGDGHLLAPGGLGVLQVQSQASAGIGFSIEANVWPLAGPPIANIDARLVNSRGEVMCQATRTKLDANGVMKSNAFAEIGRLAFAEEEYRVIFNAGGGYADLSNSHIFVTTGVNNNFGAGMGQNVPQPSDLHLPLPF